MYRFRTHASICALAVGAFACASGQSSTPDDAGGSDAGSSSSSSSSGSSSGSSSSSSGSSSGSSGSSGGTDAGASAQDAGVADGTVNAGDSSSGGAPDSGSTATGCAGLPLCDDFDSTGEAPGQPPSAALWTLVGTAGCSGNGNPGAQTIYPIVVDSTQFHSAPNSVKITGGDSCGPLMINTSAFAQLHGGEVYGRYYVRISDSTVLVHHAVLTALGFLSDAGIGLDINDYNSYLELAPEAQGGLSTTTLSWQTTDSDHLPNTDSTGAMSSTYLPSDRFACLEFHTSASTNAIEVWIDGTLVPGLTSPPAPPSANSSSMWTPPSPLAPTSMGLGWMSFNTQAMTVWFDDVALGTKRIGCP